MAKSNLDVDAIVKYATTRRGDGSLPIYKEVAAKFNCRPEYVGKVLRRAGHYRSGGRPREVDHKALIAFATTPVDGALPTYKQVGERFKCSPDHVGRILCDNGHQRLVRE